MTGTQPMSGKHAIVTGAAGDVGAAACELFLGEGVSVLAVDRDPVALERLAGRLAAGAAFLPHVADVSVEEDVAAFAKRAVEAFGGVDFLFNNAGIEGSGTGIWSPIPDMALADFEEIIAVNARGIFLGMKHVAPIIAARRGAIVNTSSIYGRKGARGQVAYVASKHAVSAMTAVAAKEWAEFGVRVNAIAPGAIEGRMLRDLVAAIDSRKAPGPADEPQRHNPPPIERWADPREIAELALFLCSEEASYMTGSTYSVDGGLIAS